MDNTIKTEPNYGKKFDYDPQWKGPLGIERKTTDFQFIFVYGIFILIWLGIAIYGYVVGDIHGLDYETIRAKRQVNSNNISDDMKFSPLHLLAARNIAFWFTLLAMCISLTYIILLRWFAKFIVYTVISFVCASIFTGICLFSYAYATHNDRPALLIGVIGLIILFLIVVITFFMVRKKVRIACEVIRESSKVVMFFPSSLIFSMIPYILHGMVFSYTASVLIYLIAIPQIDDGTPAYIYIFHFVNIFGFLWTMEFINAFSQMVLSGSFATWYWTMNKNYVPRNAILQFITKTMRYHMGTLALGSLILAVFRVIKRILNFISYRLKGCCNPLTCFLFGWYEFFFGRLEKFLNYLNRNAYIMCTIHGDGFIESNKNAFDLLMRNIIKVLVITKITDMILYLGHIFAVGFSLLATWVYCNNERLDNVMIFALLLVGVFSLLISISFSTVLRTAIDTIFLCVMEDYERNDDTVDKPYYMSFRLKELFLQ